MLPRLLIVDDDEEIRTQMKWALGKEYQIFLAEDRVRAIDAFMEHRPQVVLLDKKGVVRYYQPESRLLELVKTLRRE